MQPNARIWEYEFHFQKKNNNIIRNIPDQTTINCNTIQVVLIR